MMHCCQFLLLLGMAVLTAGGADAQVILANEQMDVMLNSLRATLRESNSHMVSILDKSVTVSKKVVLVTIKGTAKINGQLGDLSTVKRAGDATLSQSGTVLTLEGVFGANIGGSLKCSVSWNGIGVSTSIGVTLNNFRAFVRITHDLAVAGAVPQLREVRVQSLGTPSFNIGGLGALDWALNSISGAMTGIISSVMSDWVGSQLTNALRSAVKVIKLR